ncbi:unnamed protein product [Boreogadus saida]
MVEKNWGKGTLALTLKSMNRDMDEKGIALRELSCRTAAELPAPELPDCGRSFGGTAGSAGLPPSKLFGCHRSFGGCPAAQLRDYKPFLLHVHGVDG